LYLKSWPVRQIEDRASLSDDQRATLYELTAAIYRAAGKLKTACDADDRFTPPGRLEAREEQLKAVQESVEAISLPFSRFESELTDTQKAQLRGVLNLSNTIGTVLSGNNARRRGSQRRAHIRIFGTDRRPPASAG
jgi:hypothetical protein